MINFSLDHTKFRVLRLLLLLRVIEESNSRDFLPFETALISDQRLIISIFPLVSSNSAISLLAAAWPQ